MPQILRLRRDGLPGNVLSVPHRFTRTAAQALSKPLPFGLLFTLCLLIAAIGVIGLDADGWTRSFIAMPPWHPDAAVSLPDDFLAMATLIPRRGLSTLDRPIPIHRHTSYDETAIWMASGWPYWLVRWLASAKRHRQSAAEGRINSNFERTYRHNRQ